MSTEEQFQTYFAGYQPTGQQYEQSAAHIQKYNANLDAMQASQQAQAKAYEDMYWLKKGSDIEGAFFDAVEKGKHNSYHIDLMEVMPNVKGEILGYLKGRNPSREELTKYLENSWYQDMGMTGWLYGAIGSEKAYTQFDPVPETELPAKLEELSLSFEEAQKRGAARAVPITGATSERNALNELISQSVADMRSDADTTRLTQQDQLSQTQAANLESLVKLAGNSPTGEDEAKIKEYLSTLSDIGVEGLSNQ